MMIGQKNLKLILDAKDGNFGEIWIAAQEFDGVKMLIFSHSKNRDNNFGLFYFFYSRQTKYFQLKKSFKKF